MGANPYENMNKTYYNDPKLQDSLSGNEQSEKTIEENEETNKQKEIAEKAKAKLDYLKSLQEILSDANMDKNVRATVSNLVGNIISQLENNYLKSGNRMALEKYEREATQTLTKVIQKINEKNVTDATKIAKDFIAKQERINQLNDRDLVSNLLTRLKELPSSFISTVGERVDATNTYLKGKNDWSNMTVDALKMSTDLSFMEDIQKEINKSTGPFKVNLNLNYQDPSLGMKVDLNPFDTVQNLSGYTQENIFTNRQDLLKALLIPLDIRLKTYEKKQQDEAGKLFLTTASVAGALVARHVFTFETPNAEPINNALDLTRVGLLSLSLFSVEEYKQYSASAEGMELLKGYAAVLKTGDQQKIKAYEHILTYMVYEKEKGTTNGEYKKHLEGKKEEAKKAGFDMDTDASVKSYKDYLASVKTANDAIFKNKDQYTDYNAWKKSLEGTLIDVAAKKATLTTMGVTVKGISEDTLSAVWFGLKLKGNESGKDVNPADMSTVVLGAGLLTKEQKKEVIGKLDKLNTTIDVSKQIADIQTMEKNTLDTAIGNIADPNNTLLKEMMGFARPKSTANFSLKKDFTKETLFPNNYTTSLNTFEKFTDKSSKNNIVEQPTAFEQQFFLLAAPTGMQFVDAFMKASLADRQAYLNKINNAQPAPSKALKTLVNNLGRLMTAEGKLLEDKNELKNVADAKNDAVKSINESKDAMPTLQYYIEGLEVSEQQKSDLQDAIKKIYSKTYIGQQRIDILSAFDRALHHTKDNDKFKQDIDVVMHEGQHDFKVGKYSLSFEKRFKDKDIEDVGVEALFSGSVEKDSTVMNLKTDIQKQKKELAGDLTSLWKSAASLIGNNKGLTFDMTTFMEQSGDMVPPVASDKKNEKQIAIETLNAMKRNYDVAQKRCKAFTELVKMYKDVPNAQALYKKVTGHEYERSDSKSFSPVALFTKKQTDKIHLPGEDKLSGEEKLRLMNSLLILYPTGEKTKGGNEVNEKYNTVLEKLHRGIQKLFLVPQNNQMTDAELRSTLLKANNSIEALKKNKKFMKTLRHKLMASMTKEDIFSSFQAKMSTLKKDELTNLFDNLGFDVNTGQLTGVDKKNKTWKPLENGATILSAAQGASLLDISANKLIGDYLVETHFDIKSNCINLNIPEEFLGKIVKLAQYFKPEVTQTMGGQGQVPAIESYGAEVQPTHGIGTTEYLLGVQTEVMNLRWVGLLNWFLPRFVTPSLKPPTIEYVQAPDTRESVSIETNTVVPRQAPIPSSSAQTQRANPKEQGTNNNIPPANTTNSSVDNEKGSEGGAPTDKIINSSPKPIKQSLSESGSSLDTDLNA